MIPSRPSSFTLSAARDTVWRQTQAIWQQRNTLRVRFALGTALLLLVALVGFSVFIYLRLGNSLAAALDDSLRLSAAQAAAAVNVEDGTLTASESLPESSVIAQVRESNVTLRVLDLNRNVLQAFGAYNSLPFDTNTLDTARSGNDQLTTHSISGSSELLRVYTAPVIENGRVIGIIQVGQSLDGIHDTLEQLVQTLLIGIPLIVSVAAIGGYILASRALQPIDQITQTAQHISAADLHARLNLPPSNDEVGRLAATFDGMLARLDTSFERERRFTADASHELRTPLAAMQAILGVTRERQRTTEEYEQALDDLTGETHRLRGLVEDLLRLARGDRGTNRQTAQVDVSTMLTDVAETLAPLADEKGIVLETVIAPDLIIIGDSDDLTRLWLNLFDNAIKYTDRGNVAVVATSDASTISVEIRDSGIGIAPEHLPRLFDRFYRVDSARSSGGSGLGLAIARDIVRAHGGEITITSAPNSGTTVTVQFPHPS